MSRKMVSGGARFLGLTGPPGRRVRRFDGALGAEGCGIAFGDEYKVGVTVLTFMSPVLHDEGPEPPSFGRGLAP